MTYICDRLIGRYGRRAPYRHRTEIYLRSAERVMTEAERAAVVDFIATDPFVGDVIPGTGGLRKVRVPLTGRGKRGGARVITCFVSARGVYLLLAYEERASQSDTGSGSSAGTIGRYVVLRMK